jgi:hypothetical protein
VACNFFFYVRDNSNFVTFCIYILMLYFGPRVVHLEINCGYLTRVLGVSQNGGMGYLEQKRMLLSGYVIHLYCFGQKNMILNLSFI